MNGLESVYHRHHTKNNSHKRNHAILVKERVNFIQENIKPGSTIVDIGCRDGELIKFYNERNQYFVTGLDIDSEALSIAENKTGIKTVWCDLNSDWDIKPKSIDAVVACEVIEHLYHPGVVFKRISEILKSDGVVVGSIPHAFAIQFRIKYLFGIKQLTPMGDPTHINHFTVSELRKYLEENFKEVEIAGISTSKYKWLQFFLPFLFSHTLLFKGKKSN